MTVSSIKKLLTFKSGQFVFSAYYRPSVLADLLIESTILYRTVNDLPILPSLAATLQQDIIKRSIFGTAAIEGNPLTEKKVAEIISSGEIEASREKDEIEITNLKNAYAAVRELDSTPDFFLTETVIKKIHKTITHNIKHPANQPGYYRSSRVQVGDREHGGVYTPPKCFDDVKHLMQEFIAWINSPEIVALPPQIRAALAHYHFALIHPFDDGNGRTARLIEAMVLKAAGMRFVPVMLSNYYYLHLDDYFKAFSITRQNKDHDVTHFLRFVLAALVKSLDEIKTNITWLILKFTLKDYYGFLKEKKGLTQRQYDFLRIALDNTIKNITIKALYSSPALRILYRHVSERTARRDLEKLCEMGLIREQKDKSYELDLRALNKPE